MNVKMKSTSQWERLGTDPSFHFKRNKPCQHNDLKHRFQSCQTMNFHVNITQFVVLCYDGLIFLKRKYSLFKRLWGIIYSISRQLGNNSCWQNSPPSAIASTDERQISEGTVNSSVIKTLWYPEGKRL